MALPPLAIVDFNGWKNNSRMDAIAEFSIGSSSRQTYTQYDYPFLEWTIQDLGQENNIGEDRSIEACKYLISNSFSITAQNVIDAPDLHPGGLSGFVKPISYYAGGVGGVLDGYGDPYAYDYHADGSWRAGANFEITITEQLLDGIYRLYVIALAKNGEWGPIS